MNADTPVGKRLILDFIDYLRFKVENDALTLEEADSIAKVIQGEMHLVGTADDFARFYGKSKTNVTTVIDRRMLSRPKRRVLYSFNEFKKAVPKAWIHKDI